MKDHLFKTRVIQKILSLRQKKEEEETSYCSVRTFIKPTLDWNCIDYTNVCNWETTEFYEPPLTMHLTSQELESLAERPFVIPEFPCHSQAVERYVKDMTEASHSVAGPVRRDGVIRSKVASRADRRRKKPGYFSML